MMAATRQRELHRALAGVLTFRISRFGISTVIAAGTVANGEYREPIRLIAILNQDWLAIITNRPAFDYC